MSRSQSKRTRWDEVRIEGHGTLVEVSREKRDKWNREIDTSRICHATFAETWRAQLASVRSETGGTLYGKNAESECQKNISKVVPVDDS